MSSTPSPSRIEHLPNEVFLKIFSYLPHISLCQAWAGLNFRIDSVLRSARSRLYISSNEDLKHYAEYLQKWAEIVVSLVDGRVPWAPWSEVDIPNESTDIRPFVNLRRFSQKTNDAGLLSQISPKNFPYLEYIHLSDYPSYYYGKILFDDPFPFLTSISGVFLNEKSSKDTRINTNIRRIGVSFDYEANSFASLINFIKRLPNLTTLRVKTNKFKDTSPPPRISTKIRNISVWLENQGTLDEIDFLLEISPVKRLYLEIGSEGIYGDAAPCDFLRLAQVLNGCQTLKHVELRVWLCGEKSDIEQIRQLSPWFTTLDLAYGYQRRKSLQTYHYRFESKHLRF